MAHMQAQIILLFGSARLESDLCGNRDYTTAGTPYSVDQTMAWIHRVLECSRNILLQQNSQVLSSLCQVLESQLLTDGAESNFTAV